MYLAVAIEKKLVAANVPLVTEYDLFLMSYALFQEGQFEGEPIWRLPPYWNVDRFRSLLRTLDKRRVIISDDDFRLGVWRIAQGTVAGTAEEACCLVDPFCYVSHLSAMQRYGLTERSPEALHLSSPKRSLWNDMRDQKMAADLAGVTSGKALILAKIGFGSVVRRRPVVLHETSHPAATIEISGEKSRVAKIGRVFVDMLADPALCGGIRHVLDIWQGEALTWLNDIVPEVDKHPSKIVKVRAGYILTELLDIEDPRVDGWESCAQRGGSRKLDPDAPYASIFSERWMISLNA